MNEDSDFCATFARYRLLDADGTQIDWKQSRGGGQCPTSWLVTAPTDDLTEGETYLITFKIENEDGDQVEKDVFFVAETAA